MFKRAFEIYLFVFGMFFIFNVPIVLGASGSPRAGDVLLGFSSVVAMFLIIRAREDSQVWVIIILCSGFFAACGALFLIEGDVTSAINATRWLFSVFTIFLFYNVTNITRINVVIPLLMGFVAGGCVSAAVAVGQKLSLHPLFDALQPVTADDVWILTSLRTASVWEHPNAFSHVQSISVAAAVALAILFRRSQALLLALTFVVIAATFYASATRSAFMSQILAICLFFFLEDKIQKRIQYIGLLVIVIFGLIVAAPELLLDRFDGESYVSVKLAENLMMRLETVVGGLMFAFDNPLLTSIEHFREQLTNKFGLDATHNSFISLGTVYGVPFLFVFSGAFVVLIFRSIFARRKQDKLYLPMIVCVTIAAISEDVGLGATFPFIFVFLFFVTASEYGHLRKPDGVRFQDVIR